MDLLSLASIVLDESRPLVHRYQVFVALSQRVSFDDEKKNVTIHTLDKEFWMGLKYADKTTIYNASRLKLSSTTGVTNVESNG